MLAGPADVAALAAIHTAAFPPEEAWDEAALATLLAAGCLVLWRPGDAFIMLRIVLDEAEIITLATRPQARRQGLARHLLCAASTTCRLNGADSLFLEVSAGNAAALALYGSMEFAPVGLRAKYYADQTDAVVMRRRL